MSLKEKAKTGADIRYELEIATVTQWQFLSKVRWVRLEDAEQEIKEKSENYAKLCARLREQVIDLTLKGNELKQKLQQILDDFGDIQDYDNDDVIELHKALTKLLNEEKEAQ